MENTVPEMMDERVCFETPDVKALSEQGMMCIDMHFHTNCSDSFTDVNSLVKLARERHVGVAITDHNLISSLKKIDLKRSNVTIIPGMEVSTTDGPHILTYFYEMADLENFWADKIRPRLQACPWLALKDCTVEQLLDMLENEQCVVSGAHPMGYFHSNKGVEVCHTKGYISEETVKRLDAYEVICSGMTHSNNLSALKAAKEHGLSYTGGTDGHLLMEVGNVVTASESSDTDAFLNNIVNGKSNVIGIEKNAVEKIQMGSASFSKFVMHAPSATFVQMKQGEKSFERGLKKKIR